MKYILSIDGGGVKAIIALQLIKRIEEEFGIHFHEKFDLFGGTSSGSMIITPMIYKHMSAHDILKNIFNEDNLKNLFTRNIFSYLFPLFVPRYSSKTEEIKKQTNELKPTSKKCLITSYNISKEIPTFFKNWDTDKKNIYFDEKNVANVVDASSASPFFFPLVKYNGDYYADGGLCAMNPCDSVYIDALKLFPGEEIKVLSIGYSFVKHPQNIRFGAYWGLYQWIFYGNIIYKVSHVSIDTTHYKMKEMAKNMGHTYLRIESDINLSLDEYEKRDILIEEGNYLWHSFKEKLTEFFGDSV